MRVYGGRLVLIGGSSMNAMNETALNAACVHAAEALVRLATERGVCVSTAESCTAGMVSSYIAGVPGASAVLLGGAVTYCDDIKNHVLDVPAKTLESHTAVSGETACAMADGSRRLFGSDVAVSITGYAGPAGGSSANPVGTVYIGVATQRGARYERHLFEGDRMSVRLQSALAALKLLADGVVDDGDSA